MKLLLLLCLAAVEAGREVGVNPILEGVHYTDEVLISGLHAPQFLTMDYNTNTLYFSENLYHVSKFDLNTKELVHIDSDKSGYSVSVDAKTGDVYIGSDSGVYKYNKVTNKSEYLGANGTLVRQVFAKDIVYFINGRHFVHTIVDGVVSRLEDLEHVTVDHFVVDNDDWMFYSNSSGLFRQKRGTASKDAVLYSDSEVREVSDLAVNKLGDVYAYFYYEGIAPINKQKNILGDRFEFKMCHGIAFDGNNNIIYAEYVTINRYLPTEDQNSL